MGCDGALAVLDGNNLGCAGSIPPCNNNEDNHCLDFTSVGSAAAPATSGATTEEAYHTRTSESNMQPLT